MCTGLLVIVFVRKKESTGQAFFIKYLNVCLSVNNAGTQV
jgi:hypothetical protein